MTTISICNLKGGVGKTVSTIHLGAALAHRGRRVLLIDSDLQHFLTSYFRVDVRAMHSIVDVLLHDAPIASAIIECRPGLSIMPATAQMEAVDRELPHLPGADLRLRRALQAANDFDYVFIDCPSGWGATVRNAIVAADGYILPINSETPALASGIETERNIAALRPYYERCASLLGVLLTMARSTNNAEGVATSTREHWPEATFATRIRRVEKMNELATFSQTIYDAPASRVGSAREDYDSLAGEVIERCELKKAIPAKAKATAKAALPKAAKAKTR